jgi:hypothetical protein
MAGTASISPLLIAFLRSSGNTLFLWRCFVNLAFPLLLSRCPQKKQVPAILIKSNAPLEEKERSNFSRSHRDMQRPLRAPDGRFVRHAGESALRVCGGAP